MTRIVLPPTPIHETFGDFTLTYRFPTEFSFCCQLEKLSSSLVFKASGLSASVAVVVAACPAPWALVGTCLPLILCFLPDWACWSLIGCSAKQMHARGEETKKKVSMISPVIPNSLRQCHLKLLKQFHQTCSRYEVALYPPPRGMNS